MVLSNIYINSYKNATINFKNSRRYSYENEQAFYWIIGWYGIIWQLPC